MYSLHQQVFCQTLYQKDIIFFLNNVLQANDIFFFLCFESNGVSRTYIPDYVRPKSDIMKYSDVPQLMTSALHLLFYDFFSQQTIIPLPFSPDQVLPADFANCEKIFFPFFFFFSFLFFFFFTQFLVFMLQLRVLVQTTFRIFFLEKNYVDGPK